MDYEKKYNHALEVVRELQKDWASTQNRAAREIESAFPELRESEDERIISAMIRGFNSLLANQPTDTFAGVSIRDILAYLEKQEQNPKNADSIPADCVSLAKCEDRWHKVGDSLPDNPREVLCKDEAGNYFIGRYYTEEGWEISNYDDEDKPHHLNPPVSKWIDFSSEKQKEQSLRDFIDDFPYSDQKEQKPLDYPYIPRWGKNYDGNKPKLKHSVLMLTTNGVAEGEWLGEKWYQYRWSCELKDSAVLYWMHLPDLARLEKEDDKKEQKPAWSEEDERILKGIVGKIDHDQTFGVSKVEMLNFLKRLQS